MNFRWLAVATVLFSLSQALAQDPPAAKAPEQKVENQKEKVSYGIGADAARNMRRNALDIDIEMVIRGLRDAYSGAEPLYPEEEIREATSAYQKELAARRAEEAKAAADKNAKAGEAFLKENGGKEGVVTLPSGLQYKIIQQGQGKTPTDTDTIEVHYRGTLINGTEFDSSHRAGKPITFQLGRVIPGWREGLKLMPVGSKWQLFIPPNLAYGVRGTGDGAIGPNETLIFEVELLSIKEPAQKS